jgi:hypothetical protein
MVFGALAAVAALLMIGIQIWQANDARCQDAAKELRDLDYAYGYGFCTLASQSDDDSHLLERIEPTLKRAAGCSPALADRRRLDFYRHVKADLGGETSVCKSAKQAGPEDIWLRLHCLQRAFAASGTWSAGDAATWVKLADDFTARAQDQKRLPDLKTADNLENCAAISKALAYQRLAAITGQPEATGQMLTAINSIRSSEGVSAVQLAAYGLATYGSRPCTPKSPGCRVTQEELDEATGILKDPMRKEPKLAWDEILPAAHAQLWLTSMGVVVDHFAGSKSSDDEQDFGVAFRDLEEKLRNAQQTAAADFLVAERGTMKQGWYQTTVRGALSDCENRLAARRWNGAAALESMRMIFGWWAQTDLAPNPLKEVRSHEASWLGWWGPHDEIATALCSLATARIDEGVAKTRFARLRRELPQDQQLCSFFGSELWTAAAENHLWLDELAKANCFAVQRLRPSAPGLKPVLAPKAGAG